MQLFMNAYYGMSELLLLFAYKWFIFDIPNTKGVILFIT